MKTRFRPVAGRIDYITKDGGENDPVCGQGVWNAAWVAGTFLGEVQPRAIRWFWCGLTVQAKVLGTSVGIDRVLRTLVGAVDDGSPH